MANNRQPAIPLGVGPNSSGCSHLFAGWSPNMVGCAHCFTISPPAALPADLWSQEDLKEKQYAIHGVLLMIFSAAGQLEPQRILRPFRQAPGHPRVLIWGGRGPSHPRCAHAFKYKMACSTPTEPVGCPFCTAAHRTESVREENVEASLVFVRDTPCLHGDVLHIVVSKMLDLHRLQRSFAGAKTHRL